MQNFNLEQKILLLNAESKEKVNVYTYVNLETNQTETSVGIKEKLPLHKPLIATINMRMNREVFELKDGTKKYVNSTNMFITDFKEVKQ
jgi:hypothetical protein